MREEIQCPNQRQENKKRNLFKNESPSSKILTLRKIKEDRKTAPAKYLDCLSLKHNKSDNFSL